jgi:hypothetical protein
MRRGTSHWRSGTAAVLAAVLAAGVAGCGATGGAARTAPPAGKRSDGGTQNASAARPRAAVYGGPAPLLILFKRAIGVDPLSSQLVVDTDGSAAATVTLGGVSGQKRDDFTITGPRLHALRGLIARSRLSDTACCNDPNYYLYWISVGGHTWRLEQRRVPRRARRLIDRLNAITDGHSHY